MPTQSEIDDHFDILVQSAFDFVEGAISTFSDHERISLFLFASGLELFIKARLYHEHWSLVFANVDQAEFRRFENGDLKTVGAEKANDRIRLILGHNLPSSFEKIRRHRNRIAHFTHGTTEQQTNEIVARQVRGWFDLHQLLRNQWRPIFRSYRNRYYHLECMMREHRAFLKAKFQGIKDDLNNEIADGNQVESCPACGFGAMVTWCLSGDVYHGNCRVCGRIDNKVVRPCTSEECSQTISFFASDGPPDSCSACDSTYAEDLAVVLDTDPISHSNDFYRSEISCPDCSSYHTVVTHHDGFVCTQCFEYAEEVGYCEWCNEGQLGGLAEFSGLSGCEFCDGRERVGKEIILVRPENPKKKCTCNSF